MRPDCQTARSYIKIDALIRVIENQLSKSVRSCCNYSGDAIARRIYQALAMSCTDPLLRRAINSSDNSVSLDGTSRINADGILIDPISGKVRPSVKIFCIDLIKFVALWGMLLVIWFWSSVIRRGAKIGKATLLHGVPEADLQAGGNASRFEDFCRFGQLSILRPANRLVVQSTREVKSDSQGQFIYVRMPLLHLFLFNSASAIESIRFLRCHFTVLFQYAALLCRTPIACLLWRDFGLHAAAESLNQRGLIEKNIFTNTNWLQQFLWMTDLLKRRFSTEMIMYSLNSSGLIFKEDPVPANHPSIRHLRADLIYIWNESYKEVLKNEGIFCDTAIVSPVLWYLPPANYSKQRAYVRRVCVFDISPSSKQALRNRGLLGHYYNTKTMKSFLDDLIVVCGEVSLELGCRVEIVLKHKRIPTPTHDSEYFKYVDDLKNNHDLNLAAEDANMYELILESDAVVVVPYSSPAYIANYLDIPAFFYDPTGDIHPAELNSGIQFCSGKEQLRDVLNINLNKSATF